MKIVFHINQLLNNSYFLWYDFFSFIIRRENALIVSNEIDCKTAIKIKDFYSIEGQVTVIQMQDLLEEEFIFFDFGNYNCTEVNNILAKASLKVGLLGFNDSLSTKLGYYRIHRFDIVITELLPDELPLDLEPDNLDFFFSTNYFLPPLCSLTRIKRSKLENAKVLLFANSKGKVSKSFCASTFKILGESPFFEVVDEKSLSSESLHSCSVAYTILDNPQLNHSLKLESEVAVEILEHHSSRDSPIRSLFLNPCDLGIEKVFEIPLPSLRENILKLLKAGSHNTQCLDTSPVVPFEEEISTLYSLIMSEKYENLPFRQNRIKLDFSCTPNSQVGLEIPIWIMHEATEPFLRKLIEIAQQNYSITHAKELIQFANDALCIVHLTDSNCKHADSFRRNFKGITKLVTDDFIENAKKYYEYHAKSNQSKPSLLTKIANRFLRLEFPHTYIFHKPLLTTDDYQNLLKFIDYDQNFHEKNLSTHMVRVKYLSIQKRYKEAFQVCESLESEPANILLSVLSLCSALAGDYDECKRATSLCEPVDSQYGEDLVLVSYLLSVIFLENFDVPTFSNIADSYLKKKPSASWWMTDVGAMCLLSASDPNSNSPILMNCEDFLVKSCAFTQKEIGLLRTNLKVPPNYTQAKAKYLLELL